MAVVGAVAMGGRVAEEEIFGYEKVTSGASADIKMATGLARAMATEWGMSDKLGRVRYASNQQEVFLGHSVSQTTNMSDETAKLIDEEVRKLIEGGETTARSIITENQDQFAALGRPVVRVHQVDRDTEFAAVV